MKSIRILVAMLAVAALPMMAGAASYTFTPYDVEDVRSDINDLNHNYLYLWGIQAPASLKWEKIESVTINIQNITNSDTYENILKFYLVDNPNINDNAGKVDIINAYDGQSTDQAKELPALLGSKFTDYVKLATSYTDTNGVTAVDQFQYSFNDSELLTLSNYLKTSNIFGKNATFGIGFDPDCHFYNDGITLNIETAPVPEPGTIFLLGAGLIGLAGIRLRRRS